MSSQRRQASVSPLLETLGDGIFRFPPFFPSSYPSSIPFLLPPLAPIPFSSLLFLPFSSTAAKWLLQSSYRRTGELASAYTGGVQPPNGFCNVMASKENNL